MKSTHVIHVGTIAFHGQQETESSKRPHKQHTHADMACKQL